MRVRPKRAQIHPAEVKAIVERTRGLPFTRRRVSRRRFLRAAAVGATGLLTLRSTAVVPGADDEALLAQARRGIRQHRQGDGLLVVRNASAAGGEPVESCRVELEQVSHRFGFGANLFRWRQPDPILQESYRRQFAAFLNSATLHFFWREYEPEQGRPRHERMDEIVAWCMDRGVRGKGTPLAWANILPPDWLPDDPAGIRAASLGRVRDVVSQFRGRVDRWDVVNEPSLLMWAGGRYGRWAQSVGSHAFVSQHLQAARDANPDATLLINEVLTQFPAYSLLDSLRDPAGRPFYDAVGIQGHMHRGPWELSQVWRTCERYARLGVPLHWSEVTVLSGERLGGNRWGSTRYEYEVMQGHYVPRLYTLLFGHPAVEEITWWDLSDRGAWKGAAAGLLRADMSPKPAYLNLLALIRREWWTRIEGETDHDGRLPFRAFYGRHRLVVRHPDGRSLTHEFELTPGQVHPVEITLPDTAASARNDVQPPDRR